MSPVTVSSGEDRAGQLAALGWTGGEAEWLALVAPHSGVFTRSQYSAFFHTGEDRKPASRFVRALIDKKMGAEDGRGIFPGGARAVLVTGKPIYRALGIADVRHRAQPETTTRQREAPVIAVVDGGSDFRTSRRARTPERISSAAAGHRGG